MLKVNSDHKEQLAEYNRINLFNHISSLFSLMYSVLSSQKGINLHCICKLCTTTGFLTCRCFSYHPTNSVKIM